jgi:hypothetical protein
MSDQNELYYAEMEAARNDAEYQYFSARPQLAYSLAQKSLFRAGFEKAFSLLWKAPTAQGE